VFLDRPIDFNVLGPWLPARGGSFYMWTDTTLFKGRAEIRLPFKKTLPIQLRPNEKVIISDKEAGGEIGDREPHNDDAETQLEEQMPPHYTRKAVAIDMDSLRRILNTIRIEKKFKRFVIGNDSLIY
jgi:hypothetical protein